MEKLSKPVLIQWFKCTRQSRMEKNESEQYAIDWEDDKVTKLIQSNINFLNNGCSRKIGCHSKRCGCRKKDVHCGAGCECHDCSNIDNNDANLEENDQTSDESGDEQNDSEDNLEDNRNRTNY